MQHARRVGVGAQARRPPCPTARAASRRRSRLLELAHDDVEGLPAARRLAGAAVDDEIVRPLGDVGIEVVHQHAQRGFLLPALAAQRGAARRANGARLRHGAHLSRVECAVNWYLADLVCGVRTGTCTITTHLVEARDAEEAYAKAIAIGEDVATAFVGLLPICTLRSRSRSRTAPSSRGRRGAAQRRRAAHGRRQGRARDLRRAADGGGRGGGGGGGDATDLRPPRVAGIAHAQIMIPPGGEAEARRFYGELLGLTEIEKPEPLRARGGLWMQAGDRAAAHRRRVARRRAHGDARARRLRGDAARRDRARGSSAPASPSSTASRSPGCAASSCAIRSATASSSWSGRRPTLPQAASRRRPRAFLARPPPPARRARRRGDRTTTPRARRRCGGRRRGRRTRANEACGSKATRS